MPLRSLDCSSIASLLFLYCSSTSWGVFSFYGAIGDGEIGEDRGVPATYDPSPDGGLLDAPLPGLIALCAWKLKVIGVSVSGDRRGQRGGAAMADGIWQMAKRSGEATRNF